MKVAPAILLLFHLHRVPLAALWYRLSILPAPQGPQHMRVVEETSWHYRDGRKVDEGDERRIGCQIEANS